MADLKFTTKQLIEELLDMQNGYVLDFTNSSFEKFVESVIDINIYKDNRYKNHSSKAKKLRQIFNIESDKKVAKLVEELLSYCENYKLKNNKLTDYDKNKIIEVKKDMEYLKNRDESKVILDKELDELIQKISTRHAQFNQMAIDEKLKELGNLIENLLKYNGKFIELDYKNISCGFIDGSDVKELRRKVQCFRHSSKESIDERSTYTENQKKFMIEYGIVICNLIHKNIDKM
ncbi:MAG: hypothetical protein MJ191_06390 [Clostridium sp.]|nr:hypothetical protein [Clostridium sp.]